MRRHLDLTAEVVLKVTCPGVKGDRQRRQCKVPCQCVRMLCAGGSWFPSPCQSRGKSRESWSISAPRSAVGLQLPLDVSYLPSVRVVVGENLSPQSRQAAKPSSAPVPQLPTAKMGKGGAASAMYCWPIPAGVGWGLGVMLCVNVTPIFGPRCRCCQGVIDHRLFASDRGCRNQVL